MIKEGNKIIQKNFPHEGVTIFKLKLPRNLSRRKPIQKSPSIEQKEDTIISPEICHKCNEPMILLKDFNLYKCPKCGKLKKM